MPIRGGYAHDVFIVSSGEMMALYAASNISSAIKNFGARGYAKLGGIILNSRNVEDEENIVNKAAEEIGTQVVKKLPRDGHVQLAESQGKTVVDTFPESDMAGHYLNLAEIILEATQDEE